MAARAEVMPEEVNAELRIKRAAKPQCLACGRFLRVWVETFGDEALGIPVVHQVVVGSHVGYDYYNGGHEYDC